MRYGHALLTEQGENVRLPAQIREWTDIPTALATNMQLKGFAIALQLKVPGRTPAQQALHGHDLPAQQPFDEGTQFFFYRITGRICSWHRSLLQALLSSAAINGY
ncbi:hypothetical protein D3C81_1861880 [compost metagenome]